MLAFLTSPVFVTMATVVWGLVVKYVPKLQGVPNALIPYMNAVAGVVAALASAGAGIHPASVAEYVTVQVGGQAPSLDSLGLLYIGGWQAVTSGLIYEFFLRHFLPKKPS